MAVEFIGKSTFVSSQASVTQTFPTYTTGDLLVMLFSSANQAPPNNPTGSGWTLIDSQAIGTAATAGGNIIYAWYKFAASTSETAFVFGDSGNLNQTITFSFRGVDSGDPLAGTTTKTTTTAATTFSAPGMTTDAANAMVCHAIGLDADATSTTAVSNASNANLTSLTIQHAETVTTATGGGIAFITGFKATTGSTGNTTGDAATSAVKTYVTFALKPAPTTFAGAGAMTTTTTMVGAIYLVEFTAAAMTTTTTMSGAALLDLFTSGAMTTTVTMAGNGTIPGVGVVVMTIDPSLNLAVKNYLVEGSTVNLDETGILTAVLFIEGSVCNLDENGNITANTFIEGI